jgi:uncharacterized membrane protein
VRALRGDRAGALALAGHALLAFALGALAFWAPAFLERARGLPPGVAASQLAAIAVMAALGAPLAARALCAAAARVGAAPFRWAPAGACLLAGALAWAAVVSPTPAIYLPALALALLVLLAARPAGAAAATPALAPLAGVAAAGLAPLAVGALSELTNLYWAFLAVPAAALLAGAAFAAAAYAGSSRYTSASRPSA